MFFQGINRQAFLFFKQRYYRTGLERAAFSKIENGSFPFISDHIRLRESSFFESANIGRYNYHGGSYYNHHH